MYTRGGPHTASTLAAGGKCRPVYARVGQCRPGMDSGHLTAGQARVEVASSARNLGTLEIEFSGVKFELP